MLSEKVRSAAALAGCGAELEEMEKVIAHLQNSPVRNIAVLGEANSGKTTLMNRLAGTEVRKPSALSMGEKPLKVVFMTEETDPDYEVVNVSDPERAAMNIALHEIPADAAVDPESGLARPLLEKMDMVIYVLSAMRPFTAEDRNNLEAVVEKFPLLLYISRTDMLTGPGELEETLGYIRKEFSGRFEDCPCEFIDGQAESAVADILELLRETETGEIREFHIAMLEGQMKERISAKLVEKIEELEKGREARTLQEASVRASRRQDMFDWDRIRLEMMEKEQEVLDLADRKADAEKETAKAELLAEVSRASGKKAWLKESFRPSMKQKLDTAASRVIRESKDLIDFHTAWLVSEVNRRFSQRIAAKDMEYGALQVDGGNDEYKESPNVSKFLVAAGAGIVAGGTIISSIPVIPTCIVAIPASVLTAAFLKGGLDDYQKYDKKVQKFVGECCEKNFETLKKQLRGNIREHYENLIEEVRRRSEAVPDETAGDDSGEQISELRKAFRELEE